jgi:hypothetical protein
MGGDPVSLFDPSAWALGGSDSALRTKQEPS